MDEYSSEEEGDSNNFDLSCELDLAMVGEAPGQQLHSQETSCKM